ncbi:zinc transporter ZIP13-like [Ptychodera flava]|uniref:zinc transporter ZIP13-like n=1 Tax=Ptychodera flava TaxID=63121 RepID=UPI00396A5D7D
MAPTRSLLIVGVLVTLYLISVAGEIHRAKHTGKVVSQEPDFLDEEQNKFYVIAKDSSLFEVWVYTLLATILVGLSGVFPLLVIPLCGDPSKYKEGTPALNLLLSFAVGGLLGDVFLHLLPEALTHVDTENAESNNVAVGLWVIIGILSFLILEKVFTDENKIDSNESESENTGTTRQTTIVTDTRHREGNHIKARHHQINGLQKKKSSANGRHFANGQTNGHSLQNGSIAQSTEQSVNKKIKVTGYLNLLANCIDNFTHGLAVAASFLISTKIGLLTTFAIMLHEIPHEIGDFAILLRSGFDTWSAAKAQVFTSLGGVIGAIVTLLAESAKGAGDSTAWVLPFTSGGFIYIALVTVVPDLLKETNPRESFKQVLCLCGGVLVMGLVTLIGG